MHRKILTLKSKVVTSSNPEVTSNVTAGKKSPKSQPVRNILIQRLQELVNYRQTLFIQMRYGNGYCDTLSARNEGWLTVEQVPIHGRNRSPNRKAS
jgi:hypothetical protein